MRAATAPHLFNNQRTSHNNQRTAHTPRSRRLRHPRFKMEHHHPSPRRSTTPHTAASTSNPSSAVHLGSVNLREAAQPSISPAAASVEHALSVPFQFAAPLPSSPAPTAQPAATPPPRTIYDPLTSADERLEQNAGRTARLAARTLHTANAKTSDHAVSPPPLYSSGTDSPRSPPLPLPPAPTPSVAGIMSNSEEDKKMSTGAPEERQPHRPHPNGYFWNPWRHWHPWRLRRRPRLRVHWRRP